MMKAKIIVVVLLVAAGAVPCFSGAVQITGVMAADFPDGPSTQQILQSFTLGGQPVFWGLSWSLVPRRLGIEGDYLVSFLRGADSSWWLDWYAPALSLSFHPLRADRVIDPFVLVGLGCAGRVSLTGYHYPVRDALMISIFPYVAGGAALNLDGLLLEAKVTYSPYVSALPVTPIPAYPLGPFQVTVSGGFSINW